MASRLLIAGLILATVIIATAALGKPVHDPSNDDADSDRAVDLEGFVALAGFLHRAGDTDA